MNKLPNSKQLLIDELQSAGCQVKKDSGIKCPFHDDRSPSGSIYLSDDGIYRFKCFAGSCGFVGDAYDVRAKVQGRRIEDVIREEGEKQNPKTEKREPEKTYTIDEIENFTTNGIHEDTYRYTNPDTQRTDLVIVRFRDQKTGKKKFIQATPSGSECEKYFLRGPEGKKPLFNRTRVRSAKSVIVVEGEKCVKALQSIGFVSTTSPGGSGAAEHADWTPLSGKTVYLWPDNDQAGQKYIMDVKEQLKNLPEKCTILTIPIEQSVSSLPEHGDVADLLAELNPAGIDLQRKVITEILADAKPESGAGDDVLAMIQDTIEGRRCNIQLPWHLLSQSAKPLYPGTVTLVCGDPGTTKSFLILQAAIFLMQAGYKVSILELEEDRSYHLLRVLAQTAKCSGITDDEWIRNNKEQASSIIESSKDFLSMVGDRIWDSPNGQLTYDNIIEWVETQSKAGAEILIIDPVTAAICTGKAWVEDLRLIMTLKMIVRRHKNRLIIVTHTTKGADTKGTWTGGLAGGAAFSRFVQTVLWIEGYYDLKKFEISFSGQPIQAEINRKIRIVKARNGVGAGSAIGYLFNKENLCFEEVGRIV